MASMFGSIEKHRFKNGKIRYNRAPGRAFSFAGDA